MDPNDEQRWEFIRAIGNGDTATVRTMLNRNNRLLDLTPDNMGPLFIAARYGHFEIVKLLLEEDGYINLYDKREWTPLGIATSNGHVEIVKLLLDAGANIHKVETVDMANTPLNSAASAGHLQVVQLLINAGANINKKARWGGKPPLLSAVDYNKDQMVKLLLENGADFYYKDSVLGTALSIAITKLRKLERYGITPSAHIFSLSLEDGIAVVEKIIKIIRNHIRNRSLPKSAKQAILIAEEKDMTQDEAFLVFKKIALYNIKKNMKKAGDSDYNVDNQQTNTVLDNYFEKIMKIRAPSSRIAVVAARQRAAERAAERARASSSTTGGLRSRTKSGKRKSKRSQRRPPNAVCTRAQKLGIRLTVKRNNKRVYKSEKVLRTQIKNAVNKQNRKK